MRRSSMDSIDSNVPRDWDMVGSRGVSRHPREIKSGTILAHLVALNTTEHRQPPCLINRRCPYASKYSINMPFMMLNIFAS